MPRQRRDHELQLGDEVDRVRPVEEAFRRGRVADVLAGRRAVHTNLRVPAFNFLMSSAHVAVGGLLSRARSTVIRRAI